jgi:hypothetical protein
MNINKEILSKKEESILTNTMIYIGITLIVIDIVFTLSLCMIAKKKVPPSPSTRRTRAQTGHFFLVTAGS